MSDLISREYLYKEFKQRQNAALRWKEKAILDGDEERKIRADATLCFLSEVKLTIDNAPTVEERPQGKKERKKPYDWDYCSECGKVLEPQDKFCWFCGADFREADNETDN